MREIRKVISNSQIKEGLIITSEQFRSNPLFLRNQFKTEGNFEIPIIKKQDIDVSDFKLIGYDQIKHDDKEHNNSYVHFFLDDYKFEAMWNNPEPRMEKLNQYRGILSPQFSTYYTMPISLQIYNTFRSRWCGAYLQAKGLNVIPTVSWGLHNSYWFCFDGIEEGSAVAVSTLGVRKEKDFFLQGYNEMLRRIKPKTIICYSKPFDEMKVNIIEVDYAEANNLISAKTESTYPSGNKLFDKWFRGYAVATDKGTGSAGGGAPKFPGWNPSQSPGKGYEWRGKGDPSSGKGSWYNPKTKEILHPDLNHPAPY